MKTMVFDLIKNEDGKWSLFLFSEGEKVFPIWAKTNLFLDIALDYVKKLDAGANLIEEEPSDLSSNELLDTYSSISVETTDLFGMGPCISFAPSDSLDSEQTERFLTFYKNEKHELHI